MKILGLVFYLWCTIFCALVLGACRNWTLQNAYRLEGFPSG
ncbi:hypothetical protein [Borrelia coriaceae]|nr:hypothetical protein [Borrelia coriaceae]